VIIVGSNLPLIFLACCLTSLTVSTNNYSAQYSLIFNHSAGAEFPGIRPEPDMLFGAVQLHYTALNAKIMIVRSLKSKSISICQQHQLHLYFNFVSIHPHILASTTPPPPRSHQSADFAPTQRSMHKPLDTEYHCFVLYCLASLQIFCLGLLHRPFCLNRDFSAPMFVTAKTIVTLIQFSDNMGLESL
jgi:hypothetical protein